MVEDDAVRAEQNWGPAITDRRREEPKNITELWRHARNSNPRNRQTTGKHWDGKPKKERPEF